jgi:Flp pilus assembly protein TadG
VGGGGGRAPGGPPPAPAEHRQVQGGEAGRSLDSLLRITRTEGEGTAVSGKRTHIQKRSLWERGQALVEFVFVVPIFLALLLGIIDFGMGFKTYIEVTNATREGARFGALGWPEGAFPTDCGAGDDLTVVGKTCGAVGGDLASVQNVSVVYQERNGVPGEQTGDSVVVTMSYDYVFITPLGGFIDFLTGGSMPGTLTLESTTDMRLE